MVTTMERPATTPPTAARPDTLHAWRCDCPARPLLGRVVGRALKPLVPVALACPDRVIVRCPRCRNNRSFPLAQLGG